MDQILLDIKYAFKRLAAKPFTTAIIILTMAFGIGANTAVFSLMYGVMLEDLPYKESDEIVVLQHRGVKEQRNNMGYSVAEIEDFKGQLNSLDELAEFHSMRFFFLDDNPVVVSTGVVSTNFFDLIGITPIHGRNFIPDDDLLNAEPVVLLTYEFWQRHYGGDSSVVGTVVEMNDKSNRIIGVLPPFPQLPEVVEIYMPTSGCPTRSSERFISNRNSRMMSVFGRLTNDTELVDAQSEVEVVSQRMYGEYPSNYSEKTGFKSDVLSLNEESSRSIEGSLYILLATTLLILVLTSTNVANITLADYSKRTKELAIRAALGADRKTIAQQLVTEAVIMTVAGGLAGLLLAYLSLNALIDFAAQFSHRAAQVEINGPVLLFNLSIAVATGIIVGVAPAMGKEDIIAAMRQGAAHMTAHGGKVVARKALIVGQIAISFILLIAAGLMIRSFMLKQDNDPGFDPANLTAITVPLNWSKYDETAIRSFAADIKAKLSSQPGVNGVTLTSAFPFGNGGGSDRGIIRTLFNDRETQGHPMGERVSFRIIDEDYFNVIKARMLLGRDFDVTDTSDSAPVAVISESYANRFWPNESPIGRQFSVDGGNNWVDIIGVASDVYQSDLDQSEAELTEFYVPISQFPRRNMNIIVDSAQSMSILREQVKKAVREIDPQQPVSRVITLEDAIASTLASSKLISQLLTIFAFLALLITTMGLTGLLAYSVNQRTREIGIRMAIGATASEIQQMVMIQGGKLIVSGILVGVVGSYFIGSLLKVLIYGIPQTDIVTYALVSIILLSVSLLSSYIPARRASMFDPRAALRSN